MKEFVWTNSIFLSNLAFGQVGENNKGKDCFSYWEKGLPAFVCMSYVTRSPLLQLDFYKFIQLVRLRKDMDVDKH
jgi:hypothetical protein